MADAPAAEASGSNAPVTTSPEPPALSPKSASPRSPDQGQETTSPPLELRDGHEDDDDLDSSLGDDAASSTASVTESIMAYRTLHGRTYHSENYDTEYWGPNDEPQNESMDITHHVFTLALDDKLYLAPIKEDVQKVLDVGTGTGIWAIDFADRHPSAEVIGTDISPIQPLWVPPNCRFEIDDCTQDWTWEANSFDFVHQRLMFGSIADWPRLYAQAFRALKPGGWFEDFESSVDVRSDDDSITKGHVMYEWGKVFAQAGERMGRSMTVADQEGLMAGWMRDAGFVDVTETRIKIPVTGWQADPKQKEIGRFNHVAIDQGLEGYAIFMLTTVMGWSIEECQAFAAQFRKAMKSKRNHPYFEACIVYGRKPEN